MESGIQSSFIPKDAGRAVTSPRLDRSSGLSDLLLLLAIVLVVASIALAGGVFLYKQYLTTSAASKVEQLKTAQEAFQPALIEQITRLDDRMRAADQVLGRHLAPTAVFAALQQATLTTVAFSSLTLDAADPAHITVEMQGVARSVNSIALEADILSKNGVIVNPIFSGITRQQDGVHFTLAALINPASISYVGLLNAILHASGQGAEQANQQPQESAPASVFGGPEAATGNTSTSTKAVTPAAPPQNSQQ